ncbi:MAG: sugar phosphate nucleotidyltransferase [Flavihumibacter sp.]
MKAIIFAAGLGTRFKPWTDSHPKALAPVNGKSLLQRNVEYFQHYGITEVVVNVHHFAGQIENAVAEADGWGSKVVISDERGEVLETGGGLLKARSFLADSSPFMSINADVLTDLDLNRLIRFHREQEALISFAVTNRKTSRYFLVDDENRLCGWENTQTGEKRISIHKPGLVQKAYSCVALYEPAVFDLVRQRGKFSLVDVYLDLAAAHRIMTLDHSGDRFVDVGKPESIAAAEKLFR